MTNIIKSKPAPDLFFKPATRDDIFHESNYNALTPHFKPDDGTHRLRAKYEEKSKVMPLGLRVTLARHQKEISEV